MHESTYYYMLHKINSGYRTPFRIFSSGNAFTILNADIAISNSTCYPTINESSEWIFPHSQMFYYEKSDEEWCKYFNVGRQGQGFVPGDIHVEGDESVKRILISELFSNPRMVYITYEGKYN